MRSKLITIAGLAFALTSCGGGVDPLAQLCIDEAVKGLEGQVYRLDEKQLSASKKTEANGNVAFTAEVILKPGTSGEFKQTLDCIVEPGSDAAPARVIRFRFNVSGAGLAN